MREVEQRVADQRAADEARARFDTWKEVFLSALQGAAANTTDAVVHIVDQASKIADEAVERIRRRAPPVE